MIAKYLIIFSFIIIFLKIAIKFKYKIAKKLLKIREQNNISFFDSQMKKREICLKEKEDLCNKLKYLNTNLDLLNKKIKNDREIFQSKLTKIYQNYSKTLSNQKLLIKKNHSKKIIRLIFNEYESNFN